MPRTTAVVRGGGAESPVPYLVPYRTKNRNGDGKNEHICQNVN